MASREPSTQNVFVEASGVTMGAAALNVRPIFLHKNLFFEPHGRSKFVPTLQVKLDFNRGCAAGMPLTCQEGILPCHNTSPHI